MQEVKGGSTRGGDFGGTELIFMDAMAKIIGQDAAAIVAHQGRGVTLGVQAKDGGARCLWVKDTALSRIARLSHRLTTDHRVDGRRLGRVIAMQGRGIARNTRGVFVGGIERGKGFGVRITAVSCRSGRSRGAALN